MLYIIDPRPEVLVPHHESAQHLLRICHIHSILGIEISGPHPVRPRVDHLQEHLSGIVPHDHAVLLHPLIGLKGRHQELQVGGAGRLLPVDLIQIFQGIAHSEDIGFRIIRPVLGKFIDTVGHPMVDILGIVLLDKMVDRPPGPLQPSLLLRQPVQTAQGKGGLPVIIHGPRLFLLGKVAVQHMIVSPGLLILLGKDPLPQGLADLHIGLVLEGLHIFC